VSFYTLYVSSDRAVIEAFLNINVDFIGILLPYDSQGSGEYPNQRSFTCLQSLTTRQGRDRPFSEMGPRKESLSDATIRRRTADHHKHGELVPSLFFSRYPALTSGRQQSIELISTSAQTCVLALCSSSGFSYVADELQICKGLSIISDSEYLMSGF
jgi:hypothetical protein